MPATITRVEAERLDPADNAPPVLVDNTPGAEAVGANHDRVLPLIGGTRPYKYDVVVHGRRQRIYADTAMDVLAVLLGETYQSLVGEYRDAVATGDHTRRLHALWGMGQARHRHADEIRVQVQQRINDGAREAGTWEQLDEEERDDVLTPAADPEGGFPLGKIEIGPAVDDDGIEIAEAEHNVWRASVKLVINTGDYAPYNPNGEYPQPESILTDTIGGTPNVVIAGEPNLVRLESLPEPDDETTDSPDDTYLDSLASEEVNAISLTYRAVDQPDAMFRT